MAMRRLKRYSPFRESSASLKQRVERAMNLAIVREMQMLERGMHISGHDRIVSDVYRFVWDRGIMNSFTAIASMNNTSLAVVAPGIAELCLQRRWSG